MLADMSRLSELRIAIGKLSEVKENTAKLEHRSFGRGSMHKVSELRVTERRRERERGREIG